MALGSGSEGLAVFNICARQEAKKGQIIPIVSNPWKKKNEIWLISCWKSKQVHIMFNGQSLFEGHIGGLLFIHSLSSDTKLPHRASHEQQRYRHNPSKTLQSFQTNAHFFISEVGTATTWSCAPQLPIHTSTGNPASCCLLSQRALLKPTQYKL